MKLTKSHQHILQTIYAGATLKAHRYLDGSKIYQLHPLAGPAEIISRAGVDYLKELGLIESNKKFPAATYLLTSKGKNVAGELKSQDI